MQYVVINDEALGQWRLHVQDVCMHTDGTYAFETCNVAENLLTGTLVTDASIVEAIASYALEEGYVEQNVSAQCCFAYEQSIA